MSTPMVGRDGVIGRLTAALESVRDGRMAAVILSGDAGVGKSRLVHELVERAVATEAIVLRGGGMEIVESPPFWPVASALRNLLRSPAGGRAEKLLEPWSAQLDDLLSLRPAASASVAIRSRVQTLELLHRVVLRLAEEAVVVVAVEDLQWVDRSTRDLLVYLIANLTTEPVLVVVTHRTQEPVAHSEARLMITELQRHRQVSHEKIGPLDRGAVTALVDAAAPARPDLAELVWRRSAGNAFIAEETLRAVLDGDPDALPSTLRELVLLRLEPLSPAAQRVVRAVALCEGPLPHRLLDEVLGDGEPALLGALREAVDAGVVLVDAQGDGYRMRHGLMTAVVVGEMLPGERMHLHRCFGTALEGAWARDLPENDARLAHHWHAAGDVERALSATVAAAESADRLHGYAEAHRHWLRAARMAGGPSRGAVPRSTCLERAAESAHLAGNHDQAVALLAERLAAADEPAELSAALLHARTGQYLVAAGRGVEAAHAFGRATTLLPTTGAERERAEVLGGRAAALWSAGDYAESRAVAEQALALARRVGLEVEEARALATLGFSLAYLEDPAAGEAALHESLAVAERSGQPREIARAHRSLAELLAGPLNELDRGVEAARRGAARAGSLGLARSAGVGLLAAASNGLFRLGRWSEAEAVLDEAWTLSPTGVEGLELRLARARIRTGRGRFEDADDDLEAVDALSAGTVGPRYIVPLLTLRAGLEMWRGRPDLALDHVRAGLDVVELGTEDLWLVAPLVWHGARAQAELTRLAIRRADDGTAARLRGHAADLTRRATSSVPSIRDVVAAFLEMCAAEDGRAAGHSDPRAWERVARTWHDRAHPYPAAYAQLRQAEAMFALRSRSRAGTEALLAAERTARRLGAAPFLAEIVELARRARVSLTEPASEPEPRPPPVAAPAPPPAQPAGDGILTLTARELEVLRELAAGRTNREIAQRLFISQKTVGVHVTRIYAKIGVHSRVQASAVLYRAPPELRDR